MMIASGSTTSSQDTPLTLKPLEEAPLSVYLSILRDNGYAEDAAISEELYLGILVNLDLGDGKKLTKEQVYAMPFKDVVKATELVLNETGKQLMEAIPPEPRNMMAGPDASKLSPDQLKHLMKKQSKMLEDEKVRLEHG